MAAAAAPAAEAARRVASTSALSRLAIIGSMSIVDDGHDDAVRVGHTRHVRRRAGNAGGLLEGANGLHRQDVDAVFLGTQAQRKHLARHAGDGAGL